MASNSTASMLSCQMVAPFIERVREYIPDKTKRVKISYNHDDLPVVFEFVFRWEKKAIVVYDRLSDAMAKPPVNERIVNLYEPTLEIVRMTPLDDDGTRSEAPQSLELYKWMVNIKVDAPRTGLYRQFGCTLKTCDRLTLDLCTAEDRNFQTGLSDNVGLNDLWAGDYVPIITDVLYVDPITLRIDTVVPMSSQDWNIDIKYYGY